MLTLLKTAYPRYYKDTTKEEAQNTIYLYQTMFKDEDIELILIAIKELINTFQYPPTIADIKNKMYELQHINDPLKDNNYLWDIFSKACSHSAYNSQKEYDKLPLILQRFAGSPQRLFTYSQLQASEFETVIKGQFLKQIEILKAREKEEEQMLPDVRKELKRLQAVDFLKPVNNLLNE
jgi:hypothetical protein